MRLFIVLCLISAHMTLSAVDVDAGLQGFWGFEEGAGASSIDDSRFNQQATLINNPTWTNGKIGSSLYFNGDSSYVSLGDDQRFAITGELTLSAWVKLNNPNYNAYTRIISKKYNWSDAAGFELEYNAYTNRLALIAGGSDIAYALNVDLDTNWHHVAAVLNGTQAQLYVDGQAVTMTDATAGALSAGNAPLHIARNSSAAAPFIGCIDEVRIHDQALDAATIAAQAWTGLGQRVIRWSGYNWLVKNAALMGPGPNAWNDASDAVWVDENGFLHLKIQQVNGEWKSAEVISKKVMGYGSYTTTLASSLSDIDPQMVLGVFVYKDDAHEVDVEYSAWGDAQQDAYRQFVVQPYYQSGHMHAMPGQVDGAGTVYNIDWFSDSIACSAANDEWLFPGTYTPVNNPHMHLNLWLFQGQAPQGAQAYEVVIADFNFTPEPVAEEPAGPVLHWAMDNASGALLNEVVQGHDGALLDNTAWHNDLQRGDFLCFDGRQDTVMIADDDGLDVVGNRSICFWMRNDRPGKRLYQRILSKKNHWTDASGFEVVYHPQRNELQLVGQGSKLAFTQTADLDTEWHHIVITVIGNQAQIYVDAVAQSMQRTDVGQIQDSELDLYMGRMSGGYGDFKGALDDVRIYDRVLTVDEINTLYVEGLLPLN